MKTLAVIKNELFKDYLRFVSTNDLPSVLDNPDIPVPFTCVESVENQNSDALMAQLKSYFNGSKVGNKDFYTLDEDTSKQLEFMFNLIKLSSGQAGSTVTATAPVVKTEPTQVKVEPVQTQVVEVKEEAKPVVQPTPEPIIDTPVVVEVKEEVKPVAEVVAPVVKQEEETSVFTEDDADPFGFKNQTQASVESQAEPVVEAPVVAEVKEETKPTVEMIASLGIPKGATIHFIKDETITANLVDEKTVSYDGQNMTLVEAAKAAFKKSGTVGMAVGLSNWNFEGETLKAWKEKQLN